MTSDLWNILKWRDVSNWYCSPLTLLKTLIIDSIFKNSYVFKLTNASAKQVFILKCTQINSSIYTVNLKTGTSLCLPISAFSSISLNFVYWPLIAFENMRKYCSHFHFLVQSRERCATPETCWTSHITILQTFIHVNHMLGHFKVFYFQSLWFWFYYNCFCTDTTGQIHALCIVFSK